MIYFVEITESLYSRRDVCKYLIVSKSIKRIFYDIQFVARLFHQSEYQQYYDCHFLFGNWRDVEAWPFFFQCLPQKEKVIKSPSDLKSPEIIRSCNHVGDKILRSISLGISDSDYNVLIYKESTSCFSIGIRFNRLLYKHI